MDAVTRTAERGRAAVGTDLRPYAAAVAGVALSCDTWGELNQLTRFLTPDETRRIRTAWYASRGYTR